MKIIIAGGAGFVGRNLLRMMLQNGFKEDRIVVIDFNQENLEYFNDYNIRTVSADLSQQGEWENEFENSDYLINLAAQISSPHYEPFHRNNVLSTQNLINAAKKNGTKRIIHFSSAAVLSVRNDDYSNTKSEGETLVKDSGLEYCIMQPSLMYGPTDDKNIGYLIDFAKKFPFFPIPGNGKWPRQPIYIDDICLIVIALIQDFPANEIYSINGKETIYFKDMIKIVLDEVNGFHFRLFLPVFVFKFAMMLYQKMIGNEEFTTDQVDSLTAEEVFPEYDWWDEFNITPTTFQEGVRKMLEQKK